MIKASNKPLYKIDKGIPIPPHGKNNKGLTDFVRILERGDSFDIPADEFPSMHAICKRYKRTHPGWDFTFRKLLDDKNYRIWRTA